VLLPQANVLLLEHKVSPICLTHAILSSFIEKMTPFGYVYMSLMTCGYSRYPTLSTFPHARCSIITPNDAHTVALTLWRPLLIVGTAPSFVIFDIRAHDARGQLTVGVKGLTRRCSYCSVRYWFCRDYVVCLSVRMFVCGYVKKFQFDLNVTWQFWYPGKKLLETQPIGKGSHGEYWVESSIQPNIHYWHVSTILRVEVRCCCI